MILESSPQDDPGNGCMNTSILLFNHSFFLQQQQRLTLLRPKDRLDIFLRGFLNCGGWYLTWLVGKQKTPLLVDGRNGSVQ